MTKPEHIFWGFALLAGLYLLIGSGAPPFSRAGAQSANGYNAAPLAPAAQGCGMAAGGGGCGCGGSS